MLTDILLFSVGIVVGAMNAIAGGGMLIGFPVMVALGIPPIVANATSGIVTAPGQLASAYGYRKYLRKVSWRYAWLLIPGVIGSAFGATLLRHTSPEHFKHLVPVLVLFAVLLFGFQPYLHFHLHKNLHGKHKHPVLPLVLISIGLLPVSVYGAYFGAGYGFMMLAFLGFTSIHDTHQINAMKNVAAIFVAVTSIIVIYSSHLINWRYGLIAGAGATIGGYIGALSAQKVSTHTIRVIVLVIGFAAVIYLGIHDF